MDKEKELAIQQMIDSMDKPSILENPFPAPKKTDVESDKIQIVKEKDVPKELVEQVHEFGMKETIINNDKMKREILKQSQKSIENEIDIIKTNSEKKLQDTHYNANKVACKNYGLDESVPLWQQKMMRFGSAFWFVIYWLFASITIAPVSVFFNGIKVFVKVNWLVIVLSLISYLMMISIPILIQYFLNQAG